MTGAVYCCWEHCKGRSDERNIRFRATAMLEWVCCVKPNPPSWEDPEDMFFINSVRVTPALLKSFNVTLFLVPDLRARDAAAQLDK